MRYAPSASIFAALLVAALAHEAAGQSADRPQSFSAPGTVCTSRVIARSTGLEFIRTTTSLGIVDGKQCSQIADANNPTPRRTCVNSDRNPIEVDNTIRSPHSGFYSWPLTVGKEYQHSYTSTPIAGGTPRHFTKDIKVAAYERVTAGGNSYDAFRIESRNRDMQGGWGSNETLWYAPSVSRIVKYEGSHFDKVEFLNCSNQR